MAAGVVPDRPQPGAIAPNGGGLPVRPVAPAGGAGGWWWLGCHGGAGTSTMAAVLPDGADAGRYWPVPPPGGRCRVVLVARTHAAGLRAAQIAARQWASGTLPGGIDLVGLVAVADAPGRLPRPLRELLELVSGGLPAVWRLPWVEALRRGDPPAPGLFAHLAADLQIICSDQISLGGSS